MRLQTLVANTHDKSVRDNSRYFHVNCWYISSFLVLIFTYSTDHRYFAPKYIIFSQIWEDFKFIYIVFLISATWQFNPRLNSPNLIRAIYFSLYNPIITGDNKEHTSEDELFMLIQWFKGLAFYLFCPLHSNCKCSLRDI